MKLSITGVASAPEEAPLVLRGSYVDMIRKAAEFGYEGIELHIKNPDEVNWDEIRQALQQYQICITSFGTGPSYSQESIFLTADAKEVRTEAMRRMKRFITLGKEFGAVVIIGLIKGQHKDCKNNQEYDERLDETLSECLRFAEAEGVTIVAEVIDRFESDWLMTIDEGLQLIERMGSPALKLHLDTFHMNIEEANIPEAIQKAGSHVGHLHVADTDRWYCGHGHYDFGTTFQALHEINYTGAVVLESFLYPKVEVSATKSLEFLKQYL